MKRKSNKVTNKTLKKEINYIYNLVANNKIAMNIIGDSFYNYLIMKGELESFKKHMEEKSNESNGESSKGDGEIPRESI